MGAFQLVLLTLLDLHSTPSLSWEQLRTAYFQIRFNKVNVNNTTKKYTLVAHWSDHR